MNGPPAVGAIAKEYYKYLKGALTKSRKYVQRVEIRRYFFPGRGTGFCRVGIPTQETL